MSDIGDIWEKLNSIHSDVLTLKGDVNTANALQKGQNELVKHRLDNSDAELAKLKADSTTSKTDRARDLGVIAGISAAISFAVSFVKLGGGN